MLKNTGIICGLMWFSIAILSGCGGGPGEANIKLEHKRYNEAIVLYQEYLKGKPDSVEARNKLGFAYLKAGFADRAIEEFETVLERESCNPHATLYMGLAYLNEGKSDKAIMILEKYENKTQPLVVGEVRYQLALLKTPRGKRIAADRPAAAMSRIEASVRMAAARQEEADRRAWNLSGEEGNGGNGCFAYDTGVLMADNSIRRIIDLYPGDMVRAYDMETGKKVSRKVTDTYRADQNHYYLINGALRATALHPFFTVDRGWVDVADLKVGDRVLSIDRNIEILSIEKVGYDHRVYNFRVENSHNYFVSANDDKETYYLVHN